jgi:PPOX class probable F420-dependent enzyme
MTGDAPLIDPSTPFGARVAGHLRDDVVVWLTTVSPAGTPQPSPVWFLWDGDREVVVHSRESQRVTNVAGNPRVALNFRGDRLGGDIVVLTGDARIDPSAPPAHEVPGYLAKYAEHIANLGTTPEQFAADYHVPVRITLTRLRGF